MFFQPKELGRREPRKGDIARPRGELVLSDGLIEVPGLLLRPAVIPQNRGADDVVLSIKRDEPMHLSAEGDAFDERFILPREQFF